MRRIKVFLRLIFGFSATETNAFLVLLPLMLIVITAEPVYQTYFMSKEPDNFQDRKEIDSLIAIWRVPKEKKENKTRFVKKFAPRFKPRKQEAKKQHPKFDLNSADTTQLKTIYGIGTVIARRIVTYRSNLGGFIEFNQLYEVWGLDSTVVVRLAEKSVIAPDFTPNKLAINRCSEQELARHPYVRTKVARAIVNYRLQHGDFVSTDDLRKINIIEEKIFLRIEPYITLD
jgi:DNA uptake protein ComE-like DNA-binding protein